MLSLLIFCVFITVCSTLAGWVPLQFPQVICSDEMTQAASGVILGTAFIIVVPEGYEQASESGFANLAGAAAILGFLLMLVIGRKYGHGEPSSKDYFSVSHGAPFDIDLKTPRTWLEEINLTTFGLTIHTAADGVALAAASTAHSGMKLKVLVFASVLIHKMPASFSLTSLLFKEHTEGKYSVSQIKRDILLFSITGPLVAILLALPLAYLPSTPKLFTGLCLGFSGGTFVYVTTHILEQAAQAGLGAVKYIAAGSSVALLASFLPE